MRVRPIWPAKVCVTVETQQEMNTFKVVYEKAADLASECAKGRPESLPNKTSATYRT